MPREGIALCADSSRTTHGAQTAVDACRYFGGLLIGALNGADKISLLSRHFCPIPGLWKEQPLHPEIDEIAAGSFKRKSPPAIRGAGYVVRTLEAALWAFTKSDTFREGALMAVNLGEDADTTGAVYGQIAGAYYGASQIPESLIEKLAMGSYIFGQALKLYELAEE